MQRHVADNLRSRNGGYDDPERDLNEWQNLTRLVIEPSKPHWLRRSGWPRDKPGDPTNRGDAISVAQAPPTRLDGCRDARSDIPR